MRNQFEPSKFFFDAESPCLLPLHGFLLLLAFGFVAFCTTSFENNFSIFNFTIKARYSQQNKTSEHQFLFHNNYYSTQTWQHQNGKSKHFSLAHDWSTKRKQLFLFVIKISTSQKKEKSYKHTMAFLKKSSILVRNKYKKSKI